MDASNIMKAFRRHAGKLPELIERNANEVERLAGEMKTLKKAGLIYASPHWRAKKYFYLIHPTNADGRRREYVGTDPDKIADAHAGIERAEQYDALRQQYDARLRELARIERELQHAVAGLQSLVTTKRDRSRRGVTNEKAESAAVW